MKLGRSREIIAVAVAVLHLNDNAGNFCRIVRTLDEAVAESVDGRVIARSAADKAELCIALGNCGVSRKIAALLLFKCNCRDIRESLSVAVGEDIAVNKDKLCIGIFRCGSFESVLLLIAGGDDYIRAAFYCLDKRIISVVI